MSSPILYPPLDLVHTRISIVTLLALKVALSCARTPSFLFRLLRVLYATHSLVDGANARTTAEQKIADEHTEYLVRTHLLEY